MFPKTETIRSHVSYTMTIGLSFLCLFSQVSREPHVCVEFDSLNFLKTDVLRQLVHARHTLRDVCFALRSLCSFQQQYRVLVPCSADVQMETPLEAHLDPIRWQLSEGLCGTMGARKSIPMTTLIGNPRSVAGTRVPITTRLTTLATRTKVTTGHIRCPKLQSPYVCMYPRTTARTPYVSYQLTQAVFARHNRPGNHMQTQVRLRRPGYSKDISSASPKRRKRTHQ